MMSAEMRIELWERASSRPPRPRRSELLACSTSSTAPGPQLAVGAANASLLRLYHALFGEELPCSASCPRCAVAIELDLTVQPLLAREAAEVTELAEVSVGEWRVAFRLPREQDVDAALGRDDLVAAHDELLRRCVIGCWYRAEESPLSSAPDDVLARVNERMEQCDPLALLEIELRCPDCGGQWSSCLDVAEFLWTKLDAWVRRLAHDVHRIARSYGWDERAILAMSAAKRQLYLDLTSE